MFQNPKRVGFNFFISVLKTQEIVTNDIKKLLKTLNSQRDELKRLSLIAEETINGVIVTDSNARIQWVNKSFEKNFKK